MGGGVWGAEADRLNCCILSWASPVLGTWNLMKDWHKPLGHRGRTHCKDGCCCGANWASQ